MSLIVCDRIALCVERSVKPYFKNSYTSTAIEKSSETGSDLILAIGELGEQKGFVWACVSISCHREYAGIWHIEVIAQTTVGCVDWSNSEKLEGKMYFEETRSSENECY